MNLSYQNKLSEIDRLRRDLEDFSKAHDIGEDVRYAVNLCLEEILTNIISYGYSDSDTRKHAIGLEINVTQNSLVAEVRDDGNPFDPLKDFREPDTDSALADRTPGGLGIHILKKNMDEINYRREGDFNVLVLKKIW